MNINKEKQIATLRTLHDTIKQNPFWLNFDEAFIVEIGKNFHEMACNVYGDADETNPYYVILRASTHNMCCLSRNLTYYDEYPDYFSRFKSEIILSLQFFLTNVHKFLESLDGHIDKDDKVTNYLYSSTSLCNIEARWSEKDAKYKAYSVVKSEKNLEWMISFLNKFANLNNESNTKTWAIQCLNDYNEGKEILGDYFLIKNK